MAVVAQLAPEVGVAAACASLGISRASYYRSQQAQPDESKAKAKPARSLSEAERERVLEVLHSERFVDQSPAEVYATLLDEGTFLCSIRTMYRILAEYGEVKERRNQLRHPNYQKPELLATAPKQLWSWDNPERFVRGLPLPPTLPHSVSQIRRYGATDVAVTARLLQSIALVISYTNSFNNGSDSFQGEKSTSRQKATSVCKVQITKSNTQEVAMQAILQALLSKMGHLANRNKNFC